MSLEADTGDDSRRFDVELFVTHPRLSADDISRTLDLEGHFAHSVGQPRITPNGALLQGEHKETRWRHTTRHVVQDQWFADHVVSFIESLKARREALKGLRATGGDAQLIIQFLGDGYFGDVITRDILSTLVDLELDIGIECFV
jgi:hypothetical protein